jgi:hypothetical protein
MLPNAAANAQEPQYSRNRTPPLVTKLTNEDFFEAPRGFTVYDVSSEFRVSIDTEIDN